MFKPKNLLGDEKKYLETIEECNQKIAKGTDLESSYASRGHAALMLGHSDDALQDYTRAIGINPEQGWYYCMRANILYASDEHQKALEDVTLAIKLHSPHTYNIKARLLMQTGQLQDAFYCANEAISEQPNFVSYYNRGLIYWKLRKPFESVEDFCIALGQYPGFNTFTIAVFILFAALVATSFSQPQRTADVIALWIIAAILLPMIAAILVYKFYFKNAQRFKDLVLSKGANADLLTSIQLLLAQSVSFLPLWRRFLPLALNHRGACAANKGDVRLCRKYFDAEMAWYRKAGEIRGFARAYSRTIAYLNKLRAYDEAPKLQEYSMNLLRLAYEQDATLMATYSKALLEQATIQRLLQRYDASYETIKLALSIQKQNNAIKSYQLPYEIFKGNVLTKLRRLEEATSILSTCLTQARELPRKGNQNLFVCLVYLGNALTLNNELDQAEDCLNEAKALADENNFPDAQITLKRNIGLLKYKQHDLLAADAFLKDATNELEKKSGNDSPALIEILTYHRAVLRDLSRAAEAQQLSMRIEQLTERYSIPPGNNHAI